MKEWGPIIISVIALGFSVYATYIKDLRKESLIKFAEAWDMHINPRFSFDKHLKYIKKVFDKLRQVYLIYTFTISNHGEKTSKKIILDLTIMPKELKFSNKVLTVPPYATWEPVTHPEPERKGQLVYLSPLPPGGTVTLTFYIPIESDTPDITFSQIPYAQKVQNGKKLAQRAGGLYLEEGSLKKIQKKLQKEFDEIKAREQSLKTPEE